MSVLSVPGAFESASKLAKDKPSWFAWSRMKTSLRVENYALKGIYCAELLHELFQTTMEKAKRSVYPVLPNDPAVNKNRGLVLQTIRATARVLDMQSWTDASQTGGEALFNYLDTVDPPFVEFVADHANCEAEESDKDEPKTGLTLCFSGDCQGTLDIEEFLMAVEKCVVPGPTLHPLRELHELSMTEKDAVAQRILGKHLPEDNSWTFDGSRYIPIATAKYDFKVSNMLQWYFTSNVFGSNHILPTN